VVLSAIHSCDMRLVVKSQSDLQIASSIRNMSQHSYFQYGKIGKALINLFLDVKFETLI